MGYEDKTNWIWCDSWEGKDLEIPRIVLFRCVIEIKNKPVNGKICISADTRYKLYINNCFVQVGPCKGDRQVWFFDTIDITSYVRTGENVIAVAVLRYPEHPEKGNHSMFRTATPGLYITGMILDENGDMYDFSGSDKWKYKKNESVSLIKEEQHFAPLIVHENAKGDERLFGWTGDFYDDHDWKNAVPYIGAQMPEAVSPANLFPRPIPFLYRRKKRFTGVMEIKKSVHKKQDWLEFLQGKKVLYIPAETEEVVEIDAGEEMTGYMSYAFAQGKSSKISFLYSEAYVQDGTVGPAHVPVKKDRLDKENGHLQGYKDMYQVGGYGTEIEPEIYEPYWFRTFRFVQIHIQTGVHPLVIMPFQYEETGYPLEVHTSVETSDKDMKDIWDISVRTLQRCMHESYEDCPFYEQLQYIMDSRAQILYTYAISADDRLARKCMDDLRRSQRYDGLLNCCYPNCNPNVIPGFSIYYILMIYDHMMYFGSKELVEDHISCIERILNYFRKNLTSEGYVGKIGDVNGSRFWSFIDWAKEWNTTSGMPGAGLKGPLTMESLLYIYGLQHSSKLLEFLGREQDAKRYEEQAKAVQESLRKYCVGKQGMLKDGPEVEEYSQHCQVFAILTNTVDLETGRKNLLRTINEKGYAQCTVAMRFYLFRALEKTGLYEYSKQYWNAWRKMLTLHCTTCIESEDYSRSECHAWGALALYELPSVILGVQPAEPGYKAVKIAPIPGYMTYANGVVKTPVGDIKVRWNLEENNLHLEYEVPEGIEVK